MSFETNRKFSFGENSDESIKITTLKFDRTLLISFGIWDEIPGPSNPIEPEEKSFCLSIEETESLITMLQESVNEIKKYKESA